MSNITIVSVTETTPVSTDKIPVSHAASPETPAVILISDLLTLLAAAIDAVYGDVVTHNASEFATAAQGGKADTAVQPGDQVYVGTTPVFYLDSSVTIADNVALSPSPSTYAESLVTVSADASVNSGVTFLERFISPPLGVTTIPAGSWKFHTFCATSSVAGGRTAHIHTRINKRVAKEGMTGTFTGSGTTRTFTVTGGTPFVVGDATASILTAALIETPTQTAWISGYTSSSVVTVTLTDANFVNTVDVPFNAMYYLLFGHNTGNITPAGSVFESDLTNAQSAFTGINPTDRIVAAYFAVADAGASRNISLYHGGHTHYSHIETTLEVSPVSQTITNGVTATAPSEDAVYDALALKANLAANTFTGDQTLGNNALKTIKTATFNGEISTGATTGTIYIDWRSGNFFVQSEPTGNITYDFSTSGSGGYPPAGPTRCQIRIVSDGTSSAYTITLPTHKVYGASFAGTTANKNALLSFYYDGSGWHFMGVSEV